MNNVIKTLYGYLGRGGLTWLVSVALVTSGPILLEARSDNLAPRSSLTERSSKRGGGNPEPSQTLEMLILALNSMDPSNPKAAKPAVRAVSGYISEHPDLFPQLIDLFHVRANAFRDAVLGQVFDHTANIENLLKSLLNAHENASGQTQLHLAKELLTLLEVAARRQVTIDQETFDRLVRALHYVPFKYLDIILLAKELAAKEGGSPNARAKREEEIADDLLGRTAQIMEQRRNLHDAIAVALEWNPGLILKPDHIRQLCNITGLSWEVSPEGEIIYGFLRRGLTKDTTLRLAPEDFRRIIGDLKDDRIVEFPNPWIQQIRGQALGRALATEPSLLTELLMSLKSADWHVARRVLALALGIAVQLNPTLMADLDETLQKDIGLYRMNLGPAGNATDTSSAFAEGYLAPLDHAPLEKTPGNVPKLALMDWDKDMLKVDSVADILPGLSFVRALGRTLIYQNKEGRYVALKLLTETERMETPGILDYENRWFDYLYEHRQALGLEGKYPKGLVFDDGKRVVEIPTQQIEDTAQTALSAQRTKEGKPLAVDRHDGKYTFMAYTFEDDSYFRYLNDASLSTDEFRHSSRIFLHDLFALARKGIIHTTPVDIFHSHAIQDRLENDHGRFLTMVDIINPRATGGVGRVDAWTKAVVHPNARGSGPADPAENRTLEELLKDKIISVHLQSLAVEHPEYSRDVFYLASYMSDYFLSWGLMAGSTMRETNQLDWRSPDRFADILREGFETAYRAFTGRWRVSPAADAVDWQRLSRQMAFFMAKGEPYAQFILNENMPDEIFGPDAKVFSLSPKKTPTQNWKATPDGPRWSLDGEYPDLGPFNGPFPIQELVKAWNIYVALMIGEAAQQERQSSLPRPADDIPALRPAQYSL